MSDFENDGDILEEEEEEEELIIEDEPEEEDDEKMEDEGNIDNIDEDEFENMDEEADDEEDDDLVLIEESEEKNKKNEKKNVTVPFITKYEYPKIIAIRAQQIANGSPIYIDVKNVKDKTPMNIAELEFQQGKLNNIVIKRKLPNGKVEIRKISDLKFYSFY